MRRVLIAVVAVMALTVGAAMPAAGQEQGVLEVVPDSGSPGDLVRGFVDPDIVAQHCSMSVEDFQDELSELFAIPEGGALFDAMDEWATDQGYPGGIFGIPGDVSTNPQSLAAAIMLGTLLAISGFTPSDAPQNAWESSFVLTFAGFDGTPVGEASTFDPFSGIGEVIVPEVSPGLWAVAALCLGWNPTPTADGTIAPAIAAGIEWIEANLVAPYPDDISSEEFAEVAAAGAPAILGADPQGSGILIAQGGPWVDTFCVDCDPPFSQNLLDQFCGVLPEIQTVPDQLAALFGGVDLEDPATYPSVEAVEAFINEVAALVELGDTSVPHQVAPQWSIVTAELRELIFGLTAVGFDFGLLVDLSPEDAERIVETARGEGPPDPEFDAAVEVLTAFFADNCVPEAAEPAEPTPAQARFTG